MRGWGGRAFAWKVEIEYLIALLFNAMVEIVFFRDICLQSLWSCKQRKGPGLEMCLCAKWLKSSRLAGEGANGSDIWVMMWMVFSWKLSWLMFHMFDPHGSSMNYSNNREVKAVWAGISVLKNTRILTRPLWKVGYPTEWPPWVRSNIPDPQVYRYRSMISEHGFSANIGTRISKLFSMIRDLITLRRSPGSWMFTNQIRWGEDNHYFYYYRISPDQPGKLEHCIYILQLWTAERTNCLS
jgi:hypothetical protein